MRILQIGNAQIRRFGKTRVSTEHKLYNGFVREKHRVLHFSDRDMAAFLAPFGLRDLGTGKMNRKLLETAANFQPELILLGHCDLVRNETLGAIRKALPEVRIAYRNVDPLFVPHNVAAIHRRTDSVDALFVTTAGPGLDAFRGGRAAVHYMPNPTDPAIETLDNAARDDLDIDLFFCGNSEEHTDRKDLVVFLKEALAGSAITFKTCGYFGEPNVWGADYDAVLARAKMGLNLNRREDHLYSSARLAQLMGNGILAFISRESDMERLIPEHAAVFFENREDLLEKILTYAEDDALRKEKAAAGRAHYRKHFSCEHVARYIVERTRGLPLSANYLWRDF